MGDVPQWSVAGELRPVPVAAAELSLAAKLDCAREALLLVELGLAVGLPIVGSRRRLPMRLRDEILLGAVRSALGLIGAR